MEYTGRAQLGDDDRAVEMTVQIPNVEDPEWFAVVVDGSAPPVGRGEISIVLLDGGIYNAWAGSAVVRDSTDGPKRLLGHQPLVPPVGA